MRSLWRTGGLWLGDRVVVMVSSLIVQILLARELQPQWFGELSVLLALMTLALPLARMGLSGILVKELLAHPDRERRLLSVALTWRLMGVAAALAIALVTLPAATTLLIGLALFGTALQLMEYSAQAREAPEEIIPGRLVINLGFAGIKILAAVIAPNPQWIAALFALEYATQGLWQWAQYHKRHGEPLRPRMDSAWSQVFRERAPWLLASGIAEIIYLRIDIVMLERLGGATDAGLYATAARLSEAWYALPQLLMIMLFPTLWRLRADPERWQRGVQATADGLFWGAFLIAVAMQLVAAPLIVTVFGEAYGEAAPILTLHIWAGLFVFMRALVSRWLIAEDLIRLSLWSHGLGAISNIALNLWWIPLYGPIGAAWATLVSYAIAGWVSFMCFKRTRPLAGQLARTIWLPLRWRDLKNYWRVWRRWWAVLGSNQ